MVDFIQTPGILNITATHGDDFSFALDFDINLNGYSFVSKVITIATNALVTITVTNVDLALGKLTLSMSKTTLTTLNSATHHWYLDWNTTGGGATGVGPFRRVLAGTFKVVDYP
jgi:hypothetical protein